MNQRVNHQKLYNFLVDLKSLLERNDYFLDSDDGSLICNKTGYMGIIEVTEGKDLFIDVWDKHDTFCERVATEDD